jgi:pyruvate/2-oxoglutarate dehydrogenase complex dihydrolipoamide dehydrogenase (E3) component
VTILETGDQLGDGMPPRLLTRLLVWLDEQHVRVLTGVREYRDITDAGITVVDREGRVQTIEADAIIVALPQQSNAGVLEAIKGLVAEVHLVGPSDEGKSWMIVDAIAKGHEAGCAV